MLQRFLILLSAASLLSGCALFDARGEWVPIPAQVKADCPDPVSDPFPASGSHNEIEAWGVRWGLKYQECRNGKRDLARAVNRREEDQ